MKSLSNKYSCILFDLDGTLIDTDYLIVHTFQTLYNLYRDGKQTPIEDIYYFSGPPIKESLMKEFPNQDIDFMLKEFQRISLSFYETDCKLYPSVLELLKELKTNGLKLGVVTNKIRKTTHYCLSLLGIEHFFDAIVACDDVKEGKPSPEGIIKAINQIANKKDKDKVLYIGDNESDLESANNAGIDCLLIYNGPRFKSRDLPCKYKVDSISDIGDILL